MKYNQISLMKLQPNYDLRKHFEFCRLKAKIYLFLKCKVGEMLLPYACIFEIVRQKYKNENISRLIKSYGIIVKESKPITAKINNDLINFEVII